MKDLLLSENIFKYFQLKRLIINFKALVQLLKTHIASFPFGERFFFRFVSAIFTTEGTGQFSSRFEANWIIARPLFFIFCILFFFWVAPLLRTHDPVNNLLIRGWGQGPQADGARQIIRGPTHRTYSVFFGYPQTLWTAIIQKIYQ